MGTAQWAVLGTVVGIVILVIVIVAVFGDKGTDDWDKGE